LGGQKNDDSTKEAKNVAKNGVVTKNEADDDVDDKNNFGCHVCHELFRIPTELNEHVRVEHPNVFGGAKKLTDVIDLCSSSEEDSDEEYAMSEDESSDDDDESYDDASAPESSDDDDESYDDASAAESSDDDSPNRLKRRTGATLKVQFDDGQSTPKLVDRRSSSIRQLDAFPASDVTLPANDPPETSNVTVQTEKSKENENSKKRKKSEKSVSKRRCQRDDSTDEKEKFDFENHIENYRLRCRKKEKGRLVCIYCKFYCRKQFQLYRHVAAVHLKTHLRAHFVKPGNKCGICDRVMKSSGGLLNHLGNVHKTIPKKLIEANPPLDANPPPDANAISTPEPKDNHSGKRKLSLWSCFRCSKKPSSAQNAICHLVTHFKSEVNLLFMRNACNQSCSPLGMKTIVVEL
jgi:hypothetical protein